MDARLGIPLAHDRVGDFDYAFLDPPFNIGHPYAGYDDRQTPTDYADLIIDTVTASWRCLSDTGVLALHGPDAVAEAYLRIMADLGGHRVRWINWHYRFAQDTPHNWPDTRCHCLFYARDPKRYTWRPERVRVPSDRAAVYDDPRTNERSDTSDTPPGMRLPGTVWGIPSDGPYWGRVQGNNHERVRVREIWEGLGYEWGKGKSPPNQLPEVYAIRHLSAYTDPGNIKFVARCISKHTAGHDMKRKCGS